MTPYSVTRQQMIDALREGLEKEEWVLAAWLGGSDATGRTDELSDIDIQMVVPDERVQDTFELSHRILEALAPIELRHRFPEPTWHGHSQELLRLRDADPNHFIDLVVMRRSNPARLLGRERHGTPLELFDREGLLVPTPLDWAAHRKKMEQRLAELRVRFPLLQPLVTRGVHRGQVVESAQAYQMLTLRPLIELLRMRHCPERFDFGPRYLDRDLPPEWQKALERLAYPRSPEELLKLHAAAVAHFERQIEELNSGVWELPPRG
ncbi:MAG: nucleotidyltransferase domain-containing protein [Candidatus Eisenbacteria bacterium]|nr:nucleotidyltransferase domain-containing protein [Candidatus Eisenbacteria bacterium]